jgi:nucleotide-binding universal stress UspA family protein
MITKILVPLDGSDMSEKALLKAHDILAGTPGGTIIALRVLELPEASPLFERQQFDNAKSEERRRTNVYLDRIREEYTINDTKIEARVDTLKGDIADTIINQAAIENVDLIALTTHGRTGLKKLFFGSVAEKIIRLSPCSVVIVR